METAPLPFGLGATSHKNPATEKVRSTRLKTISLVLVAPVLAATINPVFALTFCLVEVGLFAAVFENGQGNVKDGFDMELWVMKFSPLPDGESS
jgi:hypothetical protein